MSTGIAFILVFSFILIMYLINAYFEYRKRERKRKKTEEEWRQKILDHEDKFKLLDHEVVIDLGKYSGGKFIGSCTVWNHYKTGQSLIRHMEYKTFSNYRLQDKQYDTANILLSLWKQIKRAKNKNTFKQDTWYKFSELEL